MTDGQTEQISAKEEIKAPVVEEFNKEQYAKLVKHCASRAGLFEEQSGNHSSEEWAEANPDFMILDSANVCGIVGKNKAARRFLLRFTLSEYTPRNAPPLDYDANKGPARFSVEYLKRIIGLMESIGEESVTLAAGHDYPLTIEGAHFKVILAPRVESD